MRTPTKSKDGLFYNAPLVIGIFSATDIDGALCAAYMGQVIESLGLGFCFIQLAKEPMNTPAVREKYHIPEDKHCVLFLAIGNYDAEYSARSEKGCSFTVIDRRMSDSESKFCQKNAHGLFCLSAPVIV